MMAARKAKSQRIDRIRSYLKSNWLTVLIILLLAVALGVTGYLLWQERQTEYDPLAERRRILAAVDEIYMLPDGEPNITVISNIKELEEENPEFFDDARNGDILLVYEDTAIIYRQEDNKVIKVAPVFLDQQPEDSIVQ